jgi:hypothetical protein
MKIIKIRAKGTTIVEREFTIEIPDNEDICDYITELEDEFDNFKSGKILDFAAIETPHFEVIEEDTEIN